MSMLMSMAYKISKWNRERKWRMFLSEMQPTAHMKVLDVGFNEIEYSSVDNYLEKHYPYQSSLTALGMHAADKFKERYPDVKVVQYNGGKFPFDNVTFDICWSNAVIEHVGDREHQLKFIAEMARVARRVFFTTPNRYFPIEVHTLTPFVHWCPKGIFDRYLKMVGKSYATGAYLNLLSIHDIRRMLSDLGIAEYKVIKNKLLGVTLDFIVIIR